MSFSHQLQEKLVFEGGAIQRYLWMNRNHVGMFRWPKKSRRRGRGARIDTNANSDVPNPPVWGGVEGGAFRPLSDSDLAEVNEAVLSLLETLGLSQASESMIEKVCGAGGSYTDDKRLLFPRELVAKTIHEARRDVVLYGQNSAHDLDLSGKRVHMSSGGGAPGVV